MTEIPVSNNKNTNLAETSFLNKLKIRFGILPKLIGHKWPEILFALKSAKKRRGDSLIKFIKKRKIIKMDENSDNFYFLDWHFYFSGKFLGEILADLISIWGYDCKYFKDELISLRPGFYEGPYEDNNFSIEEGDYVVDVGANIGLFSALASRQTGGNGLVYAFEPIKKSRELLSKNIKINNLFNVEIKELALSDVSGQKEFSVSDNLGNSSGYFFETEKGGFTENVEIETLDNLVREGLISKVNFIKIDIEGMERNFLLGAKETIKYFHPKIAICIYHRPDDKKVLEEIIKEIEPNYKIFFNKTKMFARYEDSN